MNFEFTEEQEAVRELAARILGDLSTPERLKEVEAGQERVDRSLWKELASSGLLSIALPESCGGAGLGFAAAGIVAEEVGRSAAAVPYGASAVSAAMPIARFGSEAAVRRWVSPFVAGESFLTSALSERGGDVMRSGVSALTDGEGWVLEGTKSYVPAVSVADAMLVPAQTQDAEIGIFVVPLDSKGVRIEPQEATDGQIEGDVELSSVRVDGDQVLATGPRAAEALEWTVLRAQTANCLETAGACQAALKLTADYTSQRKQFDKVIATFQAVGQRAADAFIDTEAVRLTAWQAAWRLSEELPASAEVAVAKFWADDGAQRVVHAAQHLHGGIGVDRDYPLHRYFLLVKHHAVVLGGATSSLLRLGETLASEPA